MPLHQRGAQRASTGRSVRLVVLAITLSFAGLAGLATGPSPTAAAAGMKVVVVVGPAGSSTAKYIANGRRYAAQARSYGAKVIELYSPNATWTKVKAAAQGANVFSELLEAVRVCSLGQISNALYAVGGQYRRGV